MAKSHLHPLRVYYEDTDFSGFTYHASYLRFLERGRTEFLRSLGVVQSALHRDGTAFVVSRMALDYLKPALMDDVLAVETKLHTLKRACMVLGQEIRREGICLLRAEVVVAVVRGGRPVRLPDSLRAALVADASAEPEQQGKPMSGEDENSGDLAARHGFSPEAVAALREAVERGGGAQAQFSHPEFGGMGQWSRGGMIMIGDMFNHALKARVDALCSELAAMPSSSAPLQPTSGGMDRGEAWWPAEFGAPAASGSQNGAGYACFPQARRLALRRDGRVSLFDTGDHRISGVSQQQGGEAADPVFTSQHGLVRLRDLAPVER